MFPQRLEWFPFDWNQCCEFHFARYVSIIGVSPEDVERDAAQDGKIMCPAILARSGIIFVENHVEPPVRLFSTLRGLAHQTRTTKAIFTTEAQRAQRKSELPVELILGVR